MQLPHKCPQFQVALSALIYVHSVKIKTTHVASRIAEHLVTLFCCNYDYTGLCRICSIVCYEVSFDNHAKQIYVLM